MKFLKIIGIFIACSLIPISHARGVNQVVIKEYGKSAYKNDPLTAEKCKKFKLTINQVKIFFSQNEFTLF